jgi:exodeoxyribonuclease-1
MQKQYLFYDLETSGINPAFDQIYQFGAILTDDKFNELDRYEIDIKQRPDVICHPMAMKTTMLSIADIQKGTTEYEGITQIHKLLNKPNTINIGYNTLSFDDNMLRFAFFRNLLTPYTHQYKDGCSRADILPVTLLFLLFQDDIIKWPKVDNKFSLKLENINAINNLYNGKAHNALVDTFVTLELTKVFNTRPKVLKYFLGYFDGVTDYKRTMKAIQNQNGVFDSYLPIVNLANVKYGSDIGFTIPALFISSEQNKKTAAFLRLDNEKLKDITSSNIEESTWFINKKYGDNIIVLPDDSRTWQTFFSNRTDVVNHNIQIFKENPSLLQAIKDHHKQLKFDIATKVDIDATLYNTPFSIYNKEKNVIDTFHSTKLESKTDVLNQFQDPTLKRLATRIILRNYLELASPKQQYSFKNFLVQSQQSNIPRDYNGDFKLTKSKAILEIDELLNDLSTDQDQRNILTD